ncbi:hypothetical protein ACOSQ4_011690 [Xanthoceras sorbifolium]
MSGKEILQQHEFALLCIDLWRVWFRRNKAIYGQLLLPAGEIVEWFCCFLNNFEEVRLKGQVPPPLQRPSPVSSPPPGVFKLNVDASVNVNLGRVGLGLMKSCS